MKYYFRKKSKKKYAHKILFEMWIECVEREKKNKINPLKSHEKTIRFKLKPNEMNVLFERM